jgi:outer membrane protein OmpA-like peptidoglycan-associated protein
MKINWIIVFLFCVSGFTIFAQDYAEFREVEITAVRDTIIRTRIRNPWRFGIMAGGQQQYGMGTLNIQRLMNDVRRGIIPMDPGNSGTGYYGSMMAEWHPMNEAWGAGMRIYMLDKRQSTAESEIISADSNLQYMATTRHNYISFAPEIQFAPGDGSLVLFGGISADLLTSSSADRGIYFQNVGDIAQVIKDTTYKAEKFRLGAHAGLEYNFFITNIQPNARLYVAPHVILSAGTLQSGILGSNWNGLTARFGLSFKLTFDETKDSVLKFDPSYVPPPVYVASARLERGFRAQLGDLSGKLATADISSFPVEPPSGSGEDAPLPVIATTKTPDKPISTGSGETTPVIATTKTPDKPISTGPGETTPVIATTKAPDTVISTKPIAQITPKEEKEPSKEPDTPLKEVDKSVQTQMPIADKTPVSKPDNTVDLNSRQGGVIAADISAKPVQQQLPRVNISYNRTQTFRFPTSTSSSLSAETQKYLDELASFMKQNPRATVRIEGHTDNIGTPTELQRISDERALQVVRYLLKKDIPRGRLFPSGQGSRKNIADNRTAEGRQANRRVEIVVVP